MNVTEALTFRGGTTEAGTTWADALTALADEVEHLRAADRRVRELCAEAQDGDVSGDYDVATSEVLAALDGEG